MAELYQYPVGSIERQINDLPEAVRKQYPDHIFETQRLEIVRELVYKELIKLFPSLDTPALELMEHDMFGWIDGRDRELAPLHDYYNIVDGMLLGIKLKDLVPYITSKNIAWKQELIDPKSLSLYWPVGNLSKYQQSSISYDFMQTRVLNDPTEYAENKRISDEKATDTKIDRDQYPIITLRYQDGTYQLLDGNRRTMRAWLKGDEAIRAWVGQVQDEPVLKDYWVSTGSLRRLLALYRDTPTEEMYHSVRLQLGALFAASSIARVNYRERCGKFSFAEKLLKEVDAHHTEIE